MNNLVREVALAISPNINDNFPEEWYDESTRAIRAIVSWLSVNLVDIEQEVDTSGDPDNECDDFTYEDPFDHIDELHVEPSKNWALEYWAKN